MDQLVNNLQKCFAGYFNAHISNVNVTVTSKTDPVYLMGQYNVVGINNVAHDTMLTFQVIEPLSKFLEGKEYPARSFYDCARHGMFDVVLKDCAVLQSMRVNYGVHNNYSTEVSLLIHDMDKFSSNVKEFSWKNYSDQFDKLMEEKLSE